MLKTDLSTALNLDTPLISAGMAFVAGPALAAAVSNAGGLGMLGTGMAPPEGLRQMIRATRTLTSRPFGVDLIGTFAEAGHIDVLVEEKIPVAVFFWDLPSTSAVAKLRAAGSRFWMQIGRMSEAKDAIARGAEALVVQGSEAGGHNRAEAPSAELFSAVRDLLPRIPLIAAGGIATGRDMAMALLRGADAVWCGTRFLASHEADAHDGYKKRVTEAGIGDTRMTRVFGPEWPDQPMRMLINEAVRVSDGRNAAALEEARGQTIGTVVLGGENIAVPRYSAILPTRSFDADLEWACLTAGECAATIRTIEPAYEIIATMMKEAQEAAGLARAGA